MRRRGFGDNDWGGATQMVKGKKFRNLHGNKRRWTLTSKKQENLGRAEKKLDNENLSLRIFTSEIEAGAYRGSYLSGEVRKRPDGGRVKGEEEVAWVHPVLSGKRTNGGRSAPIVLAIDRIDRKGGSRL